MAEAEFQGFPKETCTFLAGLAGNNDKAWFDAHRAEYQAHLVEPARSFIVAMGKRLPEISPAVNADPAVNRTLRRINRDIRFSRDKSPYKTHLDLWFWEGAGHNFGGSGFFFRMFSHRLLLGVGIHGFSKEQLAAYRRAVVDPRKGKELAAIAAGLKKAGFDLGGSHYKKVPPGFDAGHERADFLLHNALYSGKEMELPKEAHSAAFVGFCFDHFKQLAPLHRWLVGIQGG